MHMYKEWTPREGYLPALSIAQPFASAIIEGKKSIELRTWGTRYRGPLAIHAGKTWYGGIKPGSRVSLYQIRQLQETIRRLGTSRLVGDYPLGCILGIVQLVRCAPFTPEDYAQAQEQHKSNASWSPDDVGWHFAQVQALAAPVPMRGYLGLFAVEAQPLWEALKIVQTGEMP